MSKKILYCRGILSLHSSPFCQDSYACAVELHDKNLVIRNALSQSLSFHVPLDKGNEGSGNEIAFYPVKNNNIFYKNYLRNALLCEDWMTGMSWGLYVPLQASQPASPWTGYHFDPKPRLAIFTTQLWAPTPPPPPPFHPRLLDTCHVQFDNAVGER